MRINPSIQAISGQVTSDQNKNEPKSNQMKLPILVERQNKMPEVRGWTYGIEFVGRARYSVRAAAGRGLPAPPESPPRLCQRVRAGINRFWPGNCSRRGSWWYFARRSGRLSAPVLIWPQFVVKAMVAAGLICVRRRSPVGLAMVSVPNCIITQPNPCSRTGVAPVSNLKNLPLERQWEGASLQTIR